MFKENLNPYIAGKLTKKQINDNILAAVLILLAYSIGMHYYMYSLAYAVKIVLMIFTAVYSAKFANIFYYSMISDLSLNKGKEVAKNSNLLIMSLLLVLVLPVGTPLWVVVVGSVFLILFSKLVLIDTGKHIINPVILTRVLLVTLIGWTITVPFATSPTNWLVNGIFNSPLFSWLQVSGTGIDSAAGVTALNYLTHATDTTTITANLNWLELLFGLSGGAIGETSRALIILIGIYLVKNKVIDWIVPVSMIVTVFLLTFLYGSFNGLGLIYPTYHVLTGGLIFASILVATDPYTTPKEKHGKLIYGVIIGTLIVVIRVITPYPEGVMFSILIGGFLSPMLIKRYVGTQITEGTYVNIISKTSKEDRLAAFRIVLISVVLGSLILTSHYFFNTTIKEELLSENALANMSYNITEVSTSTDNNLEIYTYIVDGKNTQSIEVEVAINTSSDTISYVQVLSHNETPGIGSNIVEDESFLAQFEGIDLDLTYEVEIITGATMSSTGVGTAVKEAIETYNN